MNGRPLRGLQIWDDLEVESFRREVGNAGTRQTCEQPIGKLAVAMEDLPLHGFDGRRILEKRAVQIIFLQLLRHAPPRQAAVLERNGRRLPRYWARSRTK